MNRMKIVCVAGFVFTNIVAIVPSASAAALLVAPAVGDQLVTYGLTNVTTEQGGSITGSFTWDFTQNAFTHVDIQGHILDQMTGVAPNSYLYFHIFTSPLSGTYPQAYEVSQFMPVSVSLNGFGGAFNSNPISYNVGFDLATNLTPTTGANIVLDANAYANYDQDFWAPFTGATYAITGGSVQPISSIIVAPIPLPAALPLLGSGLIGLLGWLRHKRT